MARENCPGENSFVECDSQCPSDAICYKDITEGKVQCCKNLTAMCTATKMATYFNGTHFNGPYQHKWSSALDPELYYKDPITGAGCPYPYSYPLFEISKVLPRDFDPSSTIPLSECTSNTDCLSDEFCGESVNWINKLGVDKSNEDREPRKFCYKHPTFPDKLFIAHARNVKGLPICVEDKNCFNGGVCYTKDEWKGKLKKFRSFEMDGICVKAAICQSEDVSLLGTTVDIGTCKTDTDCLHQLKYRGFEYSQYCSTYKDDNFTVNMCCFKRKRKCTNGLQNLPPVNCSVTSDCNVNTTLWTNWCDPKHGKCCSTWEKNMWASPDGVTPLFNEPTCEGVVDGEPTSGQCPTDTNAKCMKGHCHQSGEMVNGTFVLGEFNYVTNFPCVMGSKLPDGFIYSYCNPETNTIIKLGSIEIANIDKEKSCQQDSDCTPHGYLRCIQIGSDQGACSQKMVASTTTTSISSSARTTETRITVYIALSSYWFYKYLM